MTPTFIRRCLLLCLVAASGCAIWPKEVGPTSEILKYVTNEQRQAVADLNSAEMNARVK